MLTISLNDLADVICFESVPHHIDAIGEIHACGVATDSRNVQPGNLFVAFRGEHVDGHDFVQKAQESGAVAAIVSEKVTNCDLPQFIVSDILFALASLSKWWLQQVKPTVIAITGSNGKTTVKNCIRKILARCHKVHATAGNYNNELGLPLTILSMSKEARFCVLEMGAGKPGDIRYLTDIAQPDLAVITSISSAHLEYFGCVDEVAKTKAEILEALSSEGLGVIAPGTGYGDIFGQLFTGSKLLVANGVQPNTARLTINNRDITIALDGRIYPLEFSLIGNHNLVNAAVAATIALQLGCTHQQIIEGLSSVQAERGRLQKLTISDFAVIDDTYNANPASMKAGINTLVKCNAEPWLVMGDMAELGDTEAQVHSDIGVYARKAGIKRLYGVGRLSKYSVDAFGQSGFHFDDHKQLLKILKNDVHADVCALVKGSRSSAMDLVVKGLIATSENNKNGGHC